MLDTLLYRESNVLGLSERAERMNSRHRLSYTQQKQNSYVIKEKDSKDSSEGQRLIKAYSLHYRVVIRVFFSRTHPKPRRAPGAKTAHHRRHPEYLLYLPYPPIVHSSGLLHAEVEEVELIKINGRPVLHTHEC